ncbi:MAG: hypothetical protein M1812_001106 [Candelaria pacifica]|nr:MAG: hypothetical protein M1812_001106 [Candelaria pacifica]
MLALRPRLRIIHSPSSLFEVVCQRSLTTTAHRAAEHVRIVEVGPRDGLQNEKSTVPLDIKLELIKRLGSTGVRDIEAGAFVSPKWVPQMANSSQILEHLLSQPLAANDPIAYSFLIPNLKGFEKFLSITQASQPTEQTEEAPITSPGNPNEPLTPPATPPSEEEPASNTSTQDPNDMPSSTPGVNRSTSKPSSAPHQSTEISIFAAATEAFSKANTNCTMAQSIERFSPLVSLAKARNIRVRAYISVALGCPYEGPNVSPTKVAELSRTFLEMGADEICLGDTTGMGTAPRTKQLLETMASCGIASKDLAVHFHDTYGQALVNSVVALEHGIRVFDSSVAGLGGCPYSKGATGNVATEDLVYCLHSLGVQTGINIERMAEIGKWISEKLGRGNDSRAGKAVLANLQ